MDLFHRLHNFRDHFTALEGNGGRTLSELVGFDRPIGVLPDRGAELLTSCFVLGLEVS